MGKRLILHAGMHKTGTTAIQSFLSSAAIEGATSFKWRSPNLSNLFVLLFYDRPEAHWFFKQRQVGPEELKKRRARQTANIVRQIEASHDEVFVFSAEIISVAAQRDLENCRDFFARWFDEISVFLYVRSPFAFATSMFQQSLKTGGLAGLSDVLPKYRSKLEKLDTVFGAGNVHMRVFDGVAGTSGGVVDDFLSWTDLTADGETRVVSNESLSADATATLYLLRKAVGRAPNSAQEVAGQRALVDCLREVGENRFYLTPACFQEMADVIQDDMVWVEHRMAQSFPETDAYPAGALAVSSLDALEQHGRDVVKRLTGRELEVLLQGCQPGEMARVLSEAITSAQK